MRNKKLIAIFSVLTVLTILILLNSVIFSIQHINAYCFNADSEDIEQNILDASNIRKGSSIFLLDENKVINEIEKNVAGIRVVNVERKFPNIVSINYVRVFEYIKIVSGGYVYCISNDGEVVRILEQNEAKNINLIELRIKGEVLGVDDKNKIIFSNQTELVTLQVLLSAFERLENKNVLIPLFETVDLTKNFVYLKTRTGLYWELQTIENAFEKLRLAYSVYLSYGAGSEKWQSGTLIIAGGDEFKVSYSPNDRYTYGVN